MARTLAVLLNAYPVGHVMRQGGREYVLSRLSLAQMGALQSAWRELHKDAPPSEGPFGDVLPLGRACPYYLSRHLAVLLSAMANCSLAEAVALVKADGAQAQHAATCVLFASEVVCKDTLLAAEAGGAAWTRELAELIEESIAVAGGGGA